MYIYLQQKINKIMVYFLLLVTIILIGLYFLFLKNIMNMIIFVLAFVFIIFLFNYIIRFIEQNLEHHTIYKMLLNKQIALATIQNVEFFKELRDSTFTKQFVYKIHIQLKTLESKVLELDIYENLKNSHIDCLPGDVYVTYDQNLKHVAIIPTLMIQMTPDVESIIRKYEEIYQTHYIVAIRNKGLSLKSISVIVKEMKND